MGRRTERSRNGEEGEPTTEKSGEVIGVKERGDGGDKKGLKTLGKGRERRRGQGEGGESSGARGVEGRRENGGKGGGATAGRKRRRGRQREAEGGIANKTN